MAKPLNSGKNKEKEKENTRSAAGKTQKKRSFAPQIALAVVALIWGASYVVVKDILVHVPVPAYLTLRFLLALPVVIAVFRRPVMAWWKSLPLKTGPSLMALITPGLALFCAFVLQTAGLRGTQPGIAAFLTSLIFLFVPVIESLAGEPVSWRRIAVPGVVALLGIVLLTQPLANKGNLFGGGFAAQTSQLMVLASAVAYSLHIYLSGKAASRNHGAVTFTVQGVVVLICSAAWLLFAGTGPLLSVGMPDLIRILFVAVVATGGCYVVQFVAQRLVKPRYVGLIYTLEPVAALVAGVFAGSQELTLLIAAGAICTTTAAILSVFLSRNDRKQPATTDSLNQTQRTKMTKNTTPSAKAVPGPLVAAIIAFLGAATAAINLWIKNADKDERLRKHDDTMVKNADTLHSQQKTIEIFTERGLTPAGTFDDTLVTSLADFLGAEAQRRPAHLTIITDTVMYGSLSYPAEFSRILNQIESLAKDVNGSKTGVKMLVYSDARMREVLDLQFPESKWKEKVSGKTKGLPEKLTTWINLPDVKKSLPKEPPAMLEKTANFMAGKFAPEDRAEFISCLLSYNKHLQSRFSEMGVKIYLCDSPLPFHLWLSDKADKDETVTGIISIADWISSINEPGFHIRRLTHGQFSAIADQLLESAKPLI